MSPTARSTKFQLIYGLKMSKTATLDTKSFTCAWITCVDGGYSQGEASDPSRPSP